MASAEQQPAKPQEPERKAPSTAFVSFLAEINAHTAESLIKVCTDLVNRGIGHVYLMISTPGGSVREGFALYNAVRAMPFELTTHNIGNVDSIGGIVFLAGTKRYAAKHSTFSLHGVGFTAERQTRFEEKLLREKLDSLIADRERIAAVYVERTKLSAEEIEQVFRSSLTEGPDFALKKGIIHEIRDAQIPPGAPVIQLVFQRK